MNQKLSQITKTLRFFNTIRAPQEYQKFLKTKPSVILDQHLREPKLKKPHSYYGKLAMATRTAPLEPLKYKLQDLPENHNELEPLGNVENIPFFIQRTKNQNLPVYEMYKQQRLLKYTVIKRVTGNVDELMGELVKITSNSEVEAKVGYIKVHGLHTEKIKNYLMRLGF